MVYNKNEDENELFNLGIVIKRARLKKNWTQEQLSEKVGVGAKYIMLIENNKRIPKFNVLRKIVVELNIATIEIFYPNTANISSKTKLEIMQLLEQCNEYKLNVTLATLNALVNCENNVEKW